ncbi:MAG: hypothetical protein R3F53_22100 [Gammaproteobacteria bacterium]
MTILVQEIIYAHHQAQQRLQQLLLQHTLATGMPLLAPGDELTQSINDIAAATAHQQRCMPS